MPVSKTYQKLLDKRANAVRALTFHETSMENTTFTTSFAAITLPLVESSYEKVKMVTEILEEEEEFEYDHLDPTNEKVLELYVKMETALKEILNKNQNAENVNTTSIVKNQGIHDLKLPALEIPKFSGKFEEWTTFHDTFSIYVDQSSIANVSKMHYLKKSLTGTAYRMIKNLPTTDANYKLAWESLCDRFHNKRAIVNAFLRLIIEQEPISKLDAKKIKELIDTTTQAL